MFFGTDCIGMWYYYKLWDGRVVRHKIRRLY